MDNLGMFSDAYPACPFPKSFSLHVKKIDDDPDKTTPAPTELPDSTEGIKMFDSPDKDSEDFERSLKKTMECIAQVCDTTVPDLSNTPQKITSNLDTPLKPPHHQDITSFKHHHDITSMKHHKNGTSIKHQDHPTTLHSNQTIQHAHPDPSESQQRQSPHNLNHMSSGHDLHKPTKPPPPPYPGPGVTSPTPLPDHITLGDHIAREETVGPITCKKFNTPPPHPYQRPGKRGRSDRGESWQRQKHLQFPQNGVQEKPPQYPCDTDRKQFTNPHDRRNEQYPSQDLGRKPPNYQTEPDSNIPYPPYHKKLNPNPEHFIFPECNQDLQKEFFMFYMQKCLQQNNIDPPPYTAAHTGMMTSRPAMTSQGSIMTSQASPLHQEKRFVDSTTSPINPRFLDTNKENCQPPTLAYQSGEQSCKYSSPPVPPQGAEVKPQRLHFNFPSPVAPGNTPQTPVPPTPIMGPSLDQSAAVLGPSPGFYNRTVSSAGFPNNSSASSAGFPSDSSASSAGFPNNSSASSSGFSNNSSASSTGFPNNSSSSSASFSGSSAPGYSRQGFQDGSRMPILPFPVSEPSRGFPVPPTSLPLSEHSRLPESLSGHPRIPVSEQDRSESLSAIRPTLQNEPTKPEEAKQNPPNTPPTQFTQKPELPRDQDDMSRDSDPARPRDTEQSRDQTVVHQRPPHMGGRPPNLPPHLFPTDTTPLHFHTPPPSRGFQPPAPPAPRSANLHLHSRGFVRPGIKQEPLPPALDYLDPSRGLQNGGASRGVPEPGNSLDKAIPDNLAAGYLPYPDLINKPYLPGGDFFANNVAKERFSFNFKETIGKMLSKKKNNAASETHPTGKRTKFTNEQIRVLEHYYHNVNKYVTGTNKGTLCQVTGLELSTILMWFQNKRAREKKQKTNV